MTSYPIVAGIVIASFGLFMLVAQAARMRNVVRRGASTRRAGGIAHAAAYFFWLPYVVVWLRPGPSVEPPALVLWLGLALAVAGVAFALWALATLGEHYDLTLEIHEGHEVVRAGPYGMVRHPIYTGLALHSTGAMLATGNVLFIAGTLIVTFPLFVMRARTEERLLRQELGAEYERYAREVPMLVPRLR